MKRLSGLGMLGFLALSILLTVKFSPVQAQTPGGISDDEVNRIANQLYCPVCENVSLDVCPTEACSIWRETIRQKLAAGWSDQEIKDYFVKMFGARVIGIPPKAGLSLLLYIVPPAAAIALAIGAYFILRKHKALNSAPVTPAGEPSQPPEGYRKKLIDDINKDIKG